MAATTTTFQAGTYTSLTDTFNLVLDLNDRATFYLDTLEMPQPPKADVRAFNIRTPGEVVQTVQYKNRMITATLWIRGATATALLASCRSLIAAIEQPPYTLRLQLPSGTQFSYADVVKCTHDIPFDAKAFLAGAIGTQKKRVHIIFECRPGLRGARQTLSNMVTNPGFEAPSGPGVVVFNDTFASFNAYAVQAGGALAQDTLRFPDVVTADASLRYFRLDESSGTTTFDAEANGNGTTHGSPTQGVAGLLTGDSDTCYTFAAASSQYVSVPTTGMPTGNGSLSFDAVIKFAANPAANTVIFGYGGSASKTGVSMWIDTSGKLNCDVLTGTGQITSPSALTTGVAHHVAVTWNGTTLTLYLDGSSVGTSTPGSLTIPSTPTFNIGANTAPGAFFTGQIDEPAFYGSALSAARITAHFNAFNTTPAVTANTMLVPAGGREAFGSPAWGALNTWQTRFRYTAGLTATFYLHYTDANNYLAAVVTGTSLTLNQVVGGTTHQIQTLAMQLVNGIQYWVQLTQFPAAPTAAITVQASVLTDNGGAPGTAIINGMVGLTFDGVTALVGRPQIAASGAPLGLGGNFANVHTVSLFGPGGWQFNGALGGTAITSGAWEGDVTRGASGTPANTYPNGPVTSFGAGRMDAPPAGTWNCRWNLFTDGVSPLGTQAMPVQTAGNTIQVSAWVKSSGLSASAGLALIVAACDVNGVHLSTTTVTTLTGNQAAWTQMTGSLVTPASTAYVDLRLNAFDTSVAGASANATVWWDNVQCWDSTRTGMTSMPYCELRFPMAPAQLLVTGVLGDVAAPTFIEAGCYLASWTTGQSIVLEIGRRKTATPRAVLTGGISSTVAANAANVLDPAVPPGYHVSQSTLPASLAAFSPTLTDGIGVYHLLLRAKTHNASPAANAEIRTHVYEQLASWFSTGATIVWDQPGTYLFPFTTTDAQTFVDAGQVALPPGPLVGLANPASIYALVGCDYNELANPTFGSVSVAALMPVDGEVLVAKLINATNSATVTTSWEYAYFDGVAIGNSLSTESMPIPNPGHSGGGPGTSSTGTISLNPTSDSVMYLDPTLLTPNGSGVNQLALWASDNNLLMLPVVVEMAYSPQYFYPL